MKLRSLVDAALERRVREQVIERPVSDFIIGKGNFESGHLGKKRARLTQVKHIADAETLH